MKKYYYYLLLVITIISFAVITYFAVKNARSFISSKIDNNKLYKNSREVEFSPDLDQKSLLEISKKISEDTASPKKVRDSAKLFYAKNVTDLTPVGLSEDRHKNFVDGYISLYELFKNGETPEIRAKALLSYSYLYLESCSNDEWLQEAFLILKPETFREIKATSTNKEEISARILLDVLRNSDGVYKDKAITVNIAENTMVLAKLGKSRMSKEDSEAILNEILTSVTNVYFSTSTLEKSPFGVMSLDRKMFDILLYIASEGGEKKIPFDIDKEFQRQLSTTLGYRATSKLGSYTNENNLRYGYARYLYKVDKVKNLNKIKEILGPSFSEENEKNSPGWMFGLSVSENRSRYLFLKELAKTYPELRSFLKRHGWKSV